MFNKAMLGPGKIHTKPKSQNRISGDIMLSQMFYLFIFWQTQLYGI